MDLVVMDHLVVTQRMAAEANPRTIQVVVDHPMVEGDHQMVHPVVEDRPTVHQMGRVARGMVKTSLTKRMILLSRKWRILSRPLRRLYSHHMEIPEN